MASNLGDRSADLHLVYACPQCRDISQDADQCGGRMGLRSHPPCPRVSYRLVPVERPANDSGRRSGGRALLTDKQAWLLTMVDDLSDDGGVSTRELFECLSEAAKDHDMHYEWIGWDKGGMRASLVRLERRELVTRRRKKVAKDQHAADYWTITTGGQGALEAR